MTPADSSGQRLTGHNVTQTTAPTPSSAPSQPCTNHATETTVPSLANPDPTDRDRSDDELFRALQEAVRLSIQDQIPSTDTTKQLPSLAAAASSDQLIFSLNNEFPVLDDPDGDTIVYIGAPPQMPEQTDKEYQYIVHHFEQVHVVNSATLRLMGESSRFRDDDLLGPQSVRTERKLRKLGLLAQAEAKKGGRFKYHLDLRPPNEDDEAVVLLTELTCTTGVLTWHLAAGKYRLSPLTVMGHDGFTVLPQVLNEANPLNAPGVATANGNGSNVRHPVSNDASNDTQAPPSTHPLQPTIEPEYSVLRHRSAIERLLHAIHGSDPKLDSAPKVWTYFAIARYFGCAHHERISRWITAWIYDVNNMNFIQNNPEVAYRIGLGIRSSVLVQDAFSILVGERALINVVGECNPAILSPLTHSVHGRKLEVLDDDERNRIDHAAASFVTRIRGIMYYLCRDMGWLSKCRNYATLDEVVGETPEEVELLRSTKQLIKDYVRSRICYVLCQDQTAFADLEALPETTLPFRQGTVKHYHSVYNLLDQYMRVFTKIFWLALQGTAFGEGASNTADEGTVGARTITPYSQALRKLFAQDPSEGIKAISKAELFNTIMAVNRLVHSRIHPGLEKDEQIDIPGGFGKVPEPNTEAGPSSPVVSGSAMHQSDIAEPRNLDSSPLKRRKTLETNNRPQDIPAASSTSIPSAIQGKSPMGLRKRNGMGSQGNSGSPTPKPDQPALALRPKSKGVLEHVKAYVQDHLTRPRVEDQEDQQPLVTKALSRIDPGLGTNGTNIHGRLPRATQTRAGIGNYALGSNNESATAESAIKPVITAEGAVATSSSCPAVPDMPWPSMQGNWSEHYTHEQNERPISATWAWNDDPTDIINTRVAPAKKTRAPAKKKQTSINKDLTPIEPAVLLHQVSDEISNICSAVLYPSHLFHQTGLLPTNLFDNLLCLEANEFRYLPLWVPGGLDDDTGGVFDECPVPNLDPLSSKYEPFTAGRITAPYDQDWGQDQDTDSDLTDIASQAISTVGKASKLATDGTETVKSLSTMSTHTSCNVDNSAFVACEDEGEGEVEGKSVLEQLHSSFTHSSVVQGLHDMEIMEKHDKNGNGDDDGDVDDVDDYYDDMNDFEWLEE